MQKNKVLIAAGGTGGHLFPAQALIRNLKKANPLLDILIAGGGLGSNPLFDKEHFIYEEVACASPFTTQPFAAFTKIHRGLKQSKQLMKAFSPDLVIGFGSFYSFPLLMASKSHKIPYFLVETNAFPGKVNRLFSSKAVATALQFTECAGHLKGNLVFADMPIWSEGHADEGLSQEEAKQHFGLDPEGFTLLVCGGSQGAATLNRAMMQYEPDPLLQVLHLCGRDQDSQKLEHHYQSKGIRACVKPFETAMWKARRAADLALCRAGAGTIRELIADEVPSILVPWPQASDQHQEKNAYAMEQKGGALLLHQGQLNRLGEKIAFAKNRLDQMREHLRRYKEEGRAQLSEIVFKLLCHRL